MDWREMLRVASAVNPSGGAGTTDSPAQVMQQGQSPLRHILELLSNLGREEGNPPVSPQVPEIPGIPQPSIISDDPRTGGITGNMPTAPQPYNPDPGGEVAPPTNYPNFPGNPEDNVTPGLPGQQEEDPVARIMRMYQPDHEAADIVKQMVLHPPVRNKPSKLQMILGLTAAGLRQDPELGERTMYKPYYHELEDYNQKLRPLSLLAQMERGDNSNERALAIAMMRDELGQKRVDIAQGKATAQTEHWRRQDEINSRKADVAKYLAEHPEMKPVKDMKSGTLVLINGRTGQQFDTKIPHGELSDFEFENLKNKHRLEQIGKTGEESQETARVHGEEARKTKVVIPGKNTSPTGRAGTISGTSKTAELEKQRRIRTNYQKIVSDNPELTGEFEFDANKLPHLKAKTRLTPEEQAVIQRRLRTGVDFPDEPEYWPGADTTAPGTAKPNPNTKGAGINQPPGKVRMISPDGVKGWADPKKQKELEAKGYKTISGVD